MANIENALSEWLEDNFVSVAGDHDYVDRAGMTEIAEDAVKDHFEYGGGDERISSIVSDVFDDHLRSTLNDYNEIASDKHCSTGIAFTDAVRKAMGTSEVNVEYASKLDELMVRMKRVERTMTTVRYAFLATEREQQKMADQFDLRIEEVDEPEEDPWVSIR